MELLGESMESFRKAAGSLSEMAQVHGDGAVLKSPPAHESQIMPLSPSRKLYGTFTGFHKVFLKSLLLGMARET